MRLYGRQLANQVPTSTTGNQARLMFGLMTSALGNAYATLAEYDGTGFARWSGLDAGAVDAARGYLDGTNEMLARYYADMPTSDDVLSEHQLTELRASVSGASVACKEIDDLFSTSWLAELADALIEACGTVSAAIAGTVAKVAGSFLGGAWWLIAAGVGGWLAWKYYRRRVFS